MFCDEPHFGLWVQNFHFGAPIKIKIDFVEIQCIFVSSKKVPKNHDEN